MNPGFKPHIHTHTTSHPQSQPPTPLCSTRALRALDSRTFPCCLHTLFFLLSPLSSSLLPFLSCSVSRPFPFLLPPTAITTHPYASNLIWSATAHYLPANRASPHTLHTFHTPPPSLLPPPLPPSPVEHDVWCFT